MHALLLVAMMLLQSPPVPEQAPPHEKDHEAIHREMEQLIMQVEVHQHAIDRMLNQASTGRAAVKPVAESGIGDLLQKAHQQGVENERDIQHIFELAADHVHQAGGT